MEWPLIQLKDITIKITKGTTPTTLGFEFKDTGINFIKAESITQQGCINESTFAYIDKKTHTALKRSEIQNNDILITIAGIYLGKIGLVEKHILPANTNQAVAIVRPDQRKVSPEYLKYFFLNKSTTAFLNSLCPQTAQPNLNLTQLGKLKFPLPPMNSQLKIVAILSAYDDLIENNKRRIAVLEKMAEEIYREWFVRMRFPGHEKVKFIKGVPEDWKDVRLKQLTKTITKGTTPTTFGRAFTKEGVNFIKIESIEDSGRLNKNKFAKIDKQTNELLKRSQLSEGDILFSIAGAIGTSVIIPKEVLPANTNQALAIIRPIDNQYNYYLYQTIRSDTFVNFSLGRIVQTAQANVSLSVLASTKILQPSVLVIRKYNELIQPIYNAINSIDQSIEKLIKSRDLLLIHLISGKLPVDNLDIQFPPSMQTQEDETHA